MPSRTEIKIVGKTMGTTYEVKIKHSYSNNFDIISKDIDSILKAINQSMSTYIPNSEISLINSNNMPNQTFAVSSDFEYVLILIYFLFLSFLCIHSFHIFILSHFLSYFT